MHGNMHGLRQKGWLTQVGRLVAFFCVHCSVVGAASGDDPFNLDEPPVSECENISVEMCKDLPYTMTMASDLEKEYRDQKVVMEILTSYKPLIQSNCSEYVHFLLCSHYLPNCSPQWEHPILPCRDVCEAVRLTCEPLVIKYNVHWPVDLDCSDPKLFPTKLTNDTFCMPLEEVAADHRRRSLITQSTTTSTRSTTMSPSVLSSRTECQTLFVAHHGSNGEDMCAPECFAHIKFTEEEKLSTRIAVIALAALSVILNGWLLLTFATAVKRFNYPDRPVVFVAACFLMYGLGQFVSLLLGREVSCAVSPEGKLHTVLPLSYAPPFCAVQSLALYFFFLAGCIWWVVLALSWFLTTTRKWSSEAVESCSCYFHLTALFIPTALCLGILFWRKIDSDELSGLCGVGYSDNKALIGFVVVPMLLCLFIGGILITIGTISSFSVRRLIRQSGRPEHIGKMIWKFSLYSMLFILALATLTASTTVQFFLTAQSTILTHEQHAIVSPLAYCRIFVPLIVSVLSPGWIFNRKTITSWAQLCSGHSLKFQGKKTSAALTTLPEPPAFEVPLLFSSSCSSPGPPPVPWQTPVTTDRDVQSTTTSWSRPSSFGHKVV